MLFMMRKTRARRKVLFVLNTTHRALNHAAVFVLPCAVVLKRAFAGLARGTSPFRYPKRLRLPRAAKNCLVRRGMTGKAVAHIKTHVLIVMWQCLRAYRIERAQKNGGATEKNCTAIRQSGKVERKNDTAPGKRIAVEVRVNWTDTPPCIALPPI